MNRLKKHFLILQTMVAFHAIDLGLRFVNFDRILATLLKRCERYPVRPSSPEDRRFVEVIGRAIHLIRRFDVRSRLDCLPRSLAVYWVLRRQALAVEFLMGVKKHPFGAHAWVELDGKAISDYHTEHTRYTVIKRSGLPF